MDKPEPFVTVDLKSTFNHDMISHPTDIADGEADGPFTYPFENLPESDSVFAFQGVPFHFPSKELRQPNNFVPDGQRLSVPPGRYRQILILDAATTVRTPVRLVLHYADGSSQERRYTTPKWCGPLTASDIPAVISGYRYTYRRDGVAPPGKQAARCFILAHALDADGERELVGLEFLANPRLHVFALTVSRRPRSFQPDYDSLVGRTDDPDVVYLSDIFPAYFARPTRSMGEPPYQNDRLFGIQPDGHTAAIDTPLLLGGKAFAKGIGVKCNFALTYDLTAGYDRFACSVGLDPASEGEITAKLNFYADGKAVLETPLIKDQATDVEIDLSGVSELSIVGEDQALVGEVVDVWGPADHLPRRSQACVALGDARLFKAKTPRAPGQERPGSIGSFIALDNRLASQAEAICTLQHAQPFDERGQPERPENTGWYGRACLTRAADVWIGLAKKGVSIRWSALLQRAGTYRVWLRVVGPTLGAPPEPGNCTLTLDGRAVALQTHPACAEEILPQARWFGHTWGYLTGEVELEGGMHSFSLTSRSDEPFATDRIVLELIEQAAPPQVFAPEPWVRNRRPMTIPDRWNIPRPYGWDFFCFDPEEYFPNLKAKGVKFITKWGWGDSIEDNLATGRPFMLHYRIPGLTDRPYRREELQKLADEGGQNFLGWVATEWDHCLVFHQFPSAERPGDRFEAFDQLARWYKQSAAKVGGHIVAMTASGPWQHYSCEFGDTVGVFSEVGCLEVQLGWLFNRGTARQYQVPWYSYIANGTHDTFTYMQHEYWRTAEEPVDVARNPEAGLSLSHVRRLHYFSYMLGAGAVQNEMHFHSFMVNADDGQRLSPMGEMIEEFFEFTLAHPDRGTSYTPFGIMLTKYHGDRHGCLYLDCYPNLAWGLFVKEPANFSIEEFFGCVYPGWKYALNERNIVVNTPYGEIFDPMLTTAPLEHLQTYKVLYLLGGVRDDLDTDLADRLTAYVQGGGTLVVNAEQVNETLGDELLGVTLAEPYCTADEARDPASGQAVRSGHIRFRQATPLPGTKVLLEDTEGRPLITSRDVGRGRVIVTMPEHMVQEDTTGSPLLPWVLQRLCADLLPIQVEGDAYYTVNRNRRGWVIALANNKGVYKLVNRLPECDPGKTAQVSLIVPETPTAVDEWYGEAEVRSQQTDQGCRLSLSLTPGTMKILEIRLPQ